MYPKKITKMEIKHADFFCSYADLKKLPETNYPEFAFIGRSNVGKSSLINMLLQRKNLAKTSSQPGKTRLINYFLVNKNWFLVDLPGYGYAKVSKQERQKFNKLIHGYLLGNRQNLLNTFVLVDSRIKPQNSDLEMIRTLGENQIPFSIVFTKIDKPKKNELNKNIELFKKTLRQEWEELPPMFLTSSEKKIGRKEILTYIEDIISQYKNFLSANNEQFYLTK